MTDGVPAGRAGSSVIADERRYLRGYGLGMALVAAVVSVIGLANASGTPDLDRWGTAGCLLIYLAAVGAVVRRTWRDTRWHLVAAVWAAAVLAATVVARSELRGDQIAGPADWTFAAFGYVAVVVLAGQRLSITIAAQGANLAIGVLALLMGDAVDRQMLVSFAQTAVGVTIFPMAAAMFYPRLAAVAQAAQAQIRARQDLLSREATAARLAQDRAARGAAIEATIVPLLTALADGTADPQDPLVQRAARIESARLRRMFAEADETDQPLVTEVRASMEAAERLGIAVTIEARGTLPVLSVRVRRRLLDAPMSTLVNASSRARIVLTGSPRTVSLSVVTDGPAGGTASVGAQGITTTITVNGSTTWTQSTWEADV